ncbi:melanoma-associated antigen 11-like [Perognathus longimembris pacificus]|uniref:melanoma-associated antigen 11-like n=1 Tax=Perognathus longimembris pacificus TaxID=214514 RepID=UPI002019C46C|nr:melanoma-associated antigen 11-like [Perognathus longimembris pacificus]
MMPHSRKGRQGQDNHQDQREASQGLMGGFLVPVAEEEEAIATASSSSSAVTPATSSEDPAPMVPSSPQRASSPPTALVSAIENQVIQGSRNQEWDHLLPRDNQGIIPHNPESLLGEVLALVPFLLFKYRRKELTSQAQMLEVITGHHEYFSVVFRKVSERMQLIFGLDLKEVNPTNHSYILVTSLGLTYDGIMRDVQGVPKTGLLIMVLCIIFKEGNRASEDMIWEALSNMGVYPGSQHYLFGNPRNLITETFVQERYLLYRPVPNSAPLCYEFLWGPRAHLETSKMKVLGWWAKFSDCEPTCFPSLYEEALREEREKERGP